MKTWMQTYTGKKFYLADPDPTLVDIRDIAHHLSMLCRFTGAVKQFYSVAQHSVYVAEHVAKKFRKIAILHDATEAYTGDLSRPMKNIPALHKAYSPVERTLWLCIAHQYELDRDFWPDLHSEHGIPDEIKEADDIACSTEAQELLLHPHPDWHEYFERVGRYDESIYPWSPHKAEKQFLRTWEKILAQGA